MAYDKYSVKKVFSNELVNIYCNKILDAVQQEFPGSEPKLVAEGDLSRIIQGMDLVELPVVPMVTNDPDIYKYLVKNLQSILTVETQLSFKNRIQLVTSQAFFEVWFDAAAVSLAIDGIYCRDLGEAYPQPVSPYNILLADPQVFSESVENEFYFQGWSADVKTPVRFFHLIGSAAPDSIGIDVQLENVFLTQPEGKYSSFKYQTSTINWTSPFSQSHLGRIQLSGDAAYIAIPLAENELQKNIITSCVSLDVLEPGKRTWDLLVQIHGVRADSGLTDIKITTLQVPFELYILAPDDLYVDDSPLYLAHVRNELPLPARTFEIITGANWKLSVPNYFEVTGDLVPAADTYGRKNYTGSGRQTLNIALTAAFDAFEGSFFSGTLSVTTEDDNPLSTRGRKISERALYAYMFEEHGITTDPEAMEFLIIKGIEAAEPQELRVISTEDFVVTAPFWLKVNPTAGEIFALLQVEPIDGNNLISGDYYGEILLTSASAEAVVPIVMRVVESIDEGFDAQLLNFTHDNEKFSVMYSDNPANRASINMKVNAYDFKGFPAPTELNFKGTFFNNRYKIHLGEIVARRFVPLSSPSHIGYKNYDLENEAYQLFKIYKYYRPASVNFSIDIEERSTGIVAENETFDGVLFVRGREPKKFSDDYGILNFEAGPVRVTENSQLLFNFVRRFSQHEIKIYRNTALYKTITHSPGNDSLFGLAMFFKDFRPGDVIDVKLSDIHVQQYLMFPPQQYSNHIAFLNEYNVPELFEFTGEYEFFTDKKVTSSKRYSNLVEHIENLETGKEQRFKINTGWILASNQNIVDAITDAKKVWLVQNGREISLRPVDIKMTNQDSSRQLYQYDVEFIINRENELEVYSL